MFEALNINMGYSAILSFELVLKSYKKIHNWKLPLNVLSKNIMEFVFVPFTW